MKERPMEHRWGQRLRLDEPASVSDGSGWTTPARVRDISASGAFLECRPPLGSIARVRVRLRARKVGNVLVGDLAGDVVRRTREGIAIEWDDFAPAAVARLLRGAARPGAPHVQLFAHHRRRRPG